MPELPKSLKTSRWMKREIMIWGKCVKGEKGREGRPDKKRWRLNRDMSGDARGLRGEKVRGCIEISFSSPMSGVTESNGGGETV